MAFQYPLLQNDDPAFLPPKGAGCPICGAEFKTGVVYFSAGAVPDDEDIAKLRAFLQLGFHSSASDCSGSANIDVVNDLKYGQFDMSFCSIPCLRKFFETLINDLAQQMNP